MPIRTVLFLLLVFPAHSLFAGDELKKCSASAQQCDQEIRQMLSGRRYFGAQVTEMKPAGGLVIKSVFPNGPAARAGIEANDRIIAVNGRSTAEATVRDFKRILGEARSTGTLWVIIQRRTVYRKVDVRLDPYTEEQIEKIIASHLSQSHVAIAGSPQP